MFILPEIRAHSTEGFVDPKSGANANQAAVLAMDTHSELKSVPTQPTSFPVFPFVV